MKVADTADGVVAAGREVEFGGQVGYGELGVDRLLGGFGHDVGRVVDTVAA